MFSAIREKRFAKSVVRKLLKSYSAVIANKPTLSGEPLYREVILHTKLVDPALVDDILWQAEDSVDEWTTDSSKGLGLRQVAHFVAYSQYLGAGNLGTVISFKEVVYSMIPAEL